MENAFRKGWGVGVGGGGGGESDMKLTGVFVVTFRGQNTLVALRVLSRYLLAEKQIDKTCLVLFKIGTRLRPGSNVKLHMCRQCEVRRLNQALGVNIFKQELICS